MTSFGRLCLMVMPGFIFLSSIGVVAAQNVVRGVVQQSGTPIMLQSGEVITQYYYPAAPPQYYIPPQQFVPPPQIGFPTPQPRFLPSGQQLYLNPNPAPPPQVNIYGEVIVGEVIVGEIVEVPTPNPETEAKPPAQKVAEQNRTDEVKPSADQGGMGQSEGNANELAEKGNATGSDENPVLPEEPDDTTPSAATRDGMAAADTQTEDSGENANPGSASSESMNAQDPVEPSAEPATEKAAPSEQEEAPTAPLTEQNENPAAQADAGPQRSDSFMNPLGPIAKDQKEHLFWVTVLTLVAVMPVFVLLPLILFRHRRGRKNKETYQPKWDSSTPLELLMWGVPVVLVVFMSARLWHSTHVLDPYEEIHSKNPTVNVQVVGLDWKWLFIYPDHGIATVGEFAIPVDHPASMTLTTDTVMQSFVIPALGGQIYAMPGMQTKLNLIADQLGTMEGENTQFNGDGFAEQKFMTHVVSPEEFEAWVEKVKQQSVALDEASYKILARRTRQSKAIADLRTDGMPEGAVYFTLDDKEFFNNIMMRYMNHKPLEAKDQPGAPAFGNGDDQ